MTPPRASQLSGLAAVALAIPMLAAPAEAQTFGESALFEANDGSHVDPGETFGVTLSFYSDFANTLADVSTGLDLDGVIPGAALTPGSLAFFGCGDNAKFGGSGTLTFEDIDIATTFTLCRITFDVSVPAGTASGDYVFSTEPLTGTATPDGAFVSDLGDFTVPVDNDTVAPSSTITGPAGPVSAAFNVSVSWFENISGTPPEAIDGFSPSDLTVTNATVAFADLGGDGAQSGDDTEGVTIEVTPTGGTPITVLLPAATVQDQSGNDNLASNTYSVVYSAAGDPADDVDFSMQWLPNSVDAGDTATARFTITNNSALALTAGAFSFDIDNPSTSNFVGVPPLATPCGAGSSTSFFNSDTFAQFSGLELIAGGSCTFDLSVTTDAGLANTSYGFVTGTLSYLLDGDAVTDTNAAASLVIGGAEGGAGEIEFTKTFDAASAAPGDSIDLEFYIGATADFSATGLSFTDDLDAMLSGAIATNTPIADACGSGSTLSGTSTLTLTSGSIGAGELCRFTVTVSVPGGATDGTYTNTTGTLSATRSDTGAETIAAASDSFDVVSPAATLPTTTISGSTDDLGVGLDRDLDIRFSEAIDSLELADFDLTNATASALTGSGTDWQVTVSPIATGAVTIQVLANIAQDAEGDFNQISNPFSFTGVTPTPEINVTGNSVSIPDGDTLPIAGDHTIFASVDVAAGLTSRTFTIENLGTGPLSVTNVAISGTHSADFTVSASPAASVAAGANTTFQIQFDPSATGLRQATVTVTNDDADEASYDFAIEGTGSSAPEITVSDASGAVDIPYNDTTPSVAKGNDFGSTAVDGGTVSATFRIDNIGTADLVLGADAVSISDSTDFTVTAQPASTITSGSSSNFTIQFDPSAVGSGSGTVSIANNDSDEAPFLFALTGIGTDNAAPTGHSVAFDASTYGPTTFTAASFTIDDPEVLATFAYSISTSGGGDPVTGNGTIPTPAPGSPSEYQVTGIDVSSLSDGTLTVSVTLTDPSGNAAAAVTDTADLDLTGPTPAITTGAADPVSGAFSASIDFGEAVTGFALGDIDVANGAASAFTDAGAGLYPATITPAGDGPVTVDVAAGVAQDGAGNDNTAATQFSITNDETAPSVALSGPTDDQTGTFTVTAVFSESVTGLGLADFSATNATASNLTGSGTNYTVDMTPTATGTVTVNLPGNVAQDAAGNGNTAAVVFTVDADLNLPTLDSLIVSDADLRLEDVGTTMTLTATFSEAMDPATAPTFAFSSDMSTTLAFQSGAYSGGDTVYTATYTVLDGNQVAPDVDVSVGTATDAAGNAMADSTVADLFSVEMRRGSLSVSVAVSGAVDGAFEFDGDLGAFTVTTTGQTGTTSFADLTEGSYSFTGATADGFNLDSITCIGGTASSDVTTGAVTITLEPAGSISCEFTQIAEPDVDETQIPEVSIELPTLTDDPTTATSVFSLNNVGGEAFYFTASTDQPWLVIDPTSGSIPATGSLDFTVSFTAAILDLEPGTYNAVITVSEVSPAGQRGTVSKANSLETINIPVSVSLEPRLGELTIVTNTTSQEEGEGSFTYASTLAALDGQSVTTAGGTASISATDVLRGNYALTQLVSEGWDLASLSCTGDLDGGNVYDLVNGEVQIDLDAEESMVCTFTNRRNEDYIRGITLSAIRNFMATRADLILTNSPRLTGRMRGDRTSGTPNRFAADFQDGRLQAQMSTSLSALRKAAENDAPQVPGSEQFSLAGRTGAASLDVWMQASMSNVSDNRAGLNSEADFSIVHIGTDMMVSDSLLAGVMLQYDQADMTTGAWNSSVEGNGWMVGPYMVTRLAEATYLDVRAAWGKSDNTVNPIGTYTDSFETDRWLLEANLTGDILHGNWRVSPGIGLAYFNETQNAYTDSLGIVIPGQTITIGRLTAGPEVAYRFASENGGFVEPYLQLNALYDYDDADVFNAAGQLQTLGHFRADARLGIAAEFSNGGRLAGEISVLGLGEGQFEANSAMIRVRLPLSLQQ
ncbi:choice-of-anchor D domain-containing protein [Maricaulis sp.]|uniref:choice-of-anchor D domain-containing protein n=1 Tax=Maricaulis sp. TaxID=1486257 RepID=UPI003A90BFD1